MAKLVEILARELKEWPMACGGTYHTEAVAQDLDGGLVGLDHLKEPHPTQFNGEDWSRGCWTGYAYYVELSEDHATAIVTRDEWQAAVDALKAKDVVEWDGVGLPPAGAACELRNVAAESEWSQATVVFASRNVIVWDWSGEPAINGLCTAYAHAVEVRPLRTPEQIAAEDREKFIDELIKITCIRRGEAGLIYDAGYRKQEQK